MVDSPCQSPSDSPHDKGTAPLRRPEETPKQGSGGPPPIQNGIGGGIVASGFFFVLPFLELFYVPDWLFRLVPIPYHISVHFGVSCLFGFVFGSVVCVAHRVALRCATRTGFRRTLNMAFFLIAVIGGFALPFAIFLDP